jgi:hypothetical protein
MSTLTVNTPEDDAHLARHPEYEPGCETCDLWAHLDDECDPFLCGHCLAERTGSAQATPCTDYAADCCGECQQKKGRRMPCGRCGWQKSAHAGEDDE